MAYAALEESIRLLDGAPPSEVARLSRRVRHVALAVDRDGRVAATMFLRRGISGDPCLDTHGPELAESGWCLLGGGGGTGQDYVLAGPAATYGSRRGGGRNRERWRKTPRRPAHARGAGLGALAGEVLPRPQSFS